MEQAGNRSDSLRRARAAAERQLVPRSLQRPRDNRPDNRPDNLVEMTEAQRRERAMQRAERAGTRLMLEGNQAAEAQQLVRRLAASGAPRFDLGWPSRTPGAPPLNAVSARGIMDMLGAGRQFETTSARGTLQSRFLRNAPGRRTIEVDKEIKKQSKTLNQIAEAVGAEVDTSRETNEKLDELIGRAPALVKGAF